MLELRVMNDGQSLPLYDLPAAYGREKAARELGDTIEGLIAFLDDLGGDPDIELNGDELDGDNSEDSFHVANGLGGPGCPISDPGEDSDEDCCSAADDDPRSGFEPGSHRWFGDSDVGSEDDAEPTSWIEWQSRGSHKLEHGGERMARDRYGNSQHEDDEDDDPDTGVEDDPRGFDPEEDMCLAGDDRVASGSCTGASLVCEDTGPGDADDGEDDCIVARRPHRDRTRRTRCDRIRCDSAGREYRLRDLDDRALAQKASEL